MTSEADTKNLHTEDDPFTLLSDAQWRYVTARIDNPKFTKKDAAEYIELNPQTVYRWPDYVDQALEVARADMHCAALTVRKQALLKAMRVKLALLDNEDARLRDKVATDVIEWELGKATQFNEVSGKDGGALVISVVKMDVDEL